MQELFIRSCCRVTRLVLRLAPSAFRREFGDELTHTLGEACRHARARGPLAMLATGARELADVTRAATRARLGRPAALQPPAWRHRRLSTGVRAFDLVARDVRTGLRTLAANRWQSALAVLTLALGIGLTTTAWSVLDALILRPVPFVEADRLVEVVNTRKPSGVQYPGFERPLFLEWRAQTDLFDRVEGYDGVSAIWKGSRGAEMVPAALVTPGLFSLLGVPPLEGRYFVEGDGRDASDDLVVISERFWKERLGSKAGVVGDTLTLSGSTRRIIGVMPASFRFPNQAQVLWMPLDMSEPPSARMKERLSLAVLARMVPGATMESVTAEVESRAPRILEAVGKAEEGLFATALDPGRSIDRRVRQSILVLSGAVGFLLLIVCANVANQSLSQALARARDLAVRASLGASRQDLMRETLVESVMVGALGTGLGWALAALLLTGAMAILPSSMFFTSLNDVGLDGRAFAFTALAGLTTVLLFGLPPAMVASRPSVIDVMRRDGRTASGSRASKRLRSVLVVAEVAVSIVLLAGAAVMTRSFMKLEAVDRGFDAEPLVMLRVGFPADGYRDPRAQDRYTDELLQVLEGLPGVEAATAGSVPPGADMVTFGNLEFAHAPDVTARQVVVPIYSVWPNYFTTTGIRLIEGRPFADGEPLDSVIVSRSFADVYWPGTSAVNGAFRFTGSPRWQTVVGVADEVRQLDMADSNGSFEFYMPLETPPGTGPGASPRSPTDGVVSYRSFVVRAPEPWRVLASSRQAVAALDDRVVIWDAGMVEDNFAEAVARPRVLLFVLTLFAALGLMFAAAGLYGVLSYLVGQRLREIGVRLALGASPHEIFRLILGSGLWLTAAGLMVGLGLSFGAVRLMRTLLFEVEPTDPVSMALVVSVLAGAALVASWWPARRAMRVDPASLLRHE